jgi:hypothetical protein
LLSSKRIDEVALLASEIMSLNSAQKNHARV